MTNMSPNCEIRPSHDRINIRIEQTEDGTMSDGGDGGFVLTASCVRKTQSMHSLSHA